MFRISFSFYLQKNMDMEEKERSERKKGESKLAAGRESTRAVSKNQKVDYSPKRMNGNWL